MAKHIKNMEMNGQMKSCVITHQRIAKQHQHKSRLLDPQLWKMFLRIPKYHAQTGIRCRQYKDPRDNQTQTSKEDDRLMLISSFKNIQNKPESTNKNFRVQKLKISKFMFGQDKQFIKNSTEIEQQKQVKVIENEILGKNSIKVFQNKDKKIQNVSQGYLNDKVRSSEVVRTKRNITSGNRQYLRQNLRSINEKSMSKNGKESKLNSKIKLTQLKQKNYPILFKKQQDLKQIKSQSFVIIEFPSQKIIVSHKAITPLQIASLTKIMTFYTIIQIVTSLSIDILTQKIIISHHVNKITGTSAQLIQGEQYTIQQLLYALMLPSGNDAANQLAFWGGNQIEPNPDYKMQKKTFINQMNKNAKILELKNTKFGNPHGLPHQQAKSTALDVAKLCCYCMKINIFVEIVRCQKYQVTIKAFGYQRLVQWENTNKLLRRQGFVGLKTGITVTAGPCLAAAYNFREKTFISVLLRAPKVSSRFKQTRLLFHWALCKLYKDLNQSERIVLKKLKRRNQDLDSDNSQDEHMFIYQNNNYSQLKKRNNILTYEL